MATTLRDFRFGIEIETIGLTISQLIDALVDTLNAGLAPDAAGRAYANYSRGVTLADGRTWNVVRDGSLSGGNRSGEVVSPILTWADMEMLQNVVRGLRQHGARVDESCGIHVHVEGTALSPRGVSNLAKMMSKQESLLFHALGVHANRQRYCGLIDQDFIRRLETARALGSLDVVRDAWYGRQNAYAERYSQTRYHALNLNSLFYRGTVEFRLFNGTLHAGEVKAAVHLSLAMVAKAANSKAGVSKARSWSPATAKYDMRVFLLALGLKGDEFKSTRHHMLKNLSGSAAFRNTTRPSRPSRAAQAVAPVAAPAAPVAAFGGDEVAS